MAPRHLFPAPEAPHVFPPLLAPRPGPVWHGVERHSRRQRGQPCVGPAHGLRPPDRGGRGGRSRGGPHRVRRAARRRGEQADDGVQLLPQRLPPVFERAKAPRPGPHDPDRAGQRRGLGHRWVRHRTLGLDRRAHELVVSQ